MGRQEQATFLIKQEGNGTSIVFSAVIELCDHGVIER